MVSSQLRALRTAKDIDPRLLQLTIRHNTYTQIAHEERGLVSGPVLSRKVSGISQYRRL